MPSPIRFEFRGGRQLGENLRELGSPKVAGKICGQMTFAAAKIVKAATKQNILAHAFDTGTLEASVIIKKLSKSQSEGLDSAHIVTPRHRKTGSKKTRGKQQTAPHALYIEFGTVNMPKEPVLGPALANNIGRALDAMRKQGEKSLKLAAQRLKK